ncbi:MAG: hypothetical protein B7Y15_10510 [Bacteroidetes bacterium 24-39-8]|nr:MAG: hypothetical protein B7Y69_04805 [Sphingobacteriia bacterium 35-40-8]OYZ49295.1 MAG: hypothetical protein B7Y15_10510 [Bacteroidetes bacterium 24-39-8]OZA67591.1 MAG: hypothetical protein B7X72_03495 [Sphingobacteriia bacterium 39-39-8]
MVVVSCLLISILAVISCSKNDGTSNITCDPATSFANTVKPILDKSCNMNGCHDDIVITALNNFQTVHDGANQIKISIQSGRMPKSNSLTTAEKNAIYCWVDNGAKNN